VDSERWRKIELIYHSALEQEGGHRTAFLEQECAGDESLRQEVESLLAEERGTDGFLEAPALEVAARELATSSGPGAATHPATIGRYRILKLIGEGGMGTVYQAEQEEPRRVVALKVVKLGLAAPDRLRRFRKESQALARLQHPGIAQIYDSGSADAGFGPQPYFVMEFIDGMTLGRYAEIHRLDLRQKLLLVVRICDAVHHAHQRGLIHRDLKPGNILVDKSGQPKVLDFGVARFLEQDSRDGDPGTMRTDMGQLVGTLAYMSPEQVLGDPLEVDTRSDVYSLGVILYELLSGRLPYEVHHRQLPEAVQKIREADPAPLTSLDRDSDGDIEIIVRKALEKDKARRYSSAADLGADLQRSLNHEPITARPPSASYKLKKFIRRHRAGAAVGALTLVTLCGATVSVAWEARIARQERDRAQRRFNDVRKLARQVIFDLEYKLAAIPGTTQVRKDLVSTALDYLDGLAKDSFADPGLQAELAVAYLRIGDIQGNPDTQNLGDLPSAVQSYAKAEQLARALAAERPSGKAKGLLVVVLNAEAYGAFYADKSDGAAKAMEALGIARERSGSEPASTEAQLQLGAALACAAKFADKQGLPSAYRLEALSLFENMLARQPKDRERLRNAALAHKYIAGILLGKADPEGAFGHLKRAEELDRACVRLAPNNPQSRMDLAIDLNQWSEYYEWQGDIRKGIEYSQSAVAIRRELMSADPKDARAQDRLAYSLNELGELQLKVSAHQALASYQEAKSIAERLQTESLRAERLARSLFGLGAAYQELGDARRSCGAYAQSAKLYTKVIQQNPLLVDKAKEAERALFRCRAATQ